MSNHRIFEPLLIGDDTVIPLAVFTESVPADGDNRDAVFYFVNRSGEAIGPGSLSWEIANEVALRAGTEITESFADGTVVNIITKSGGNDGNLPYSVRAEFETPVPDDELLFAMRVPYADPDLAGGTFTLTFGDHPEDSITTVFPPFLPPDPEETFEFLGGVVLQDDIEDYSGSVFVDEVVIPASSDKIVIEILEDNSFVVRITDPDSPFFGTTYAIDEAERILTSDIESLDLGALTENGYIDVLALAEIGQFGTGQWKRILELHSLYLDALPTVQDLLGYVDAAGDILAPETLSAALAAESDTFGPLLAEVEEALANSDPGLPPSEAYDTASSALIVSYCKVFLGRPPDQAGAEYWAQEMLNGNVQADEFGNALINGLEGPEASTDDIERMNVLREAAVEFALKLAITDAEVAVDALETINAAHDEGQSPDAIEALLNEYKEAATDGDGVDDALTLPLSTFGDEVVPS